MRNFSHLSPNKKNILQKGAIIKKSKRYRLWRIWDAEKPKVLYILLNPSVGNATQDDPTIRRLYYFTEKMNLGGFYVGNLYANITPYPKELYQKKLGRDRTNLRHITAMSNHCKKVVYAWGQREKEPLWLRTIISEPLCFGLTKKGSPKHPLYLNKQTQCIPFR